jgi:hypothetical protein
MREVELVYGTVDGVDLDCRDYVESCLLETEAEPTCTCE